MATQDESVRARRDLGLPARLSMLRRSLEPTSRARNRDVAGNSRIAECANLGGDQPAYRAAAPLSDGQRKPTSIDVPLCQAWRRRRIWGWLCSLAGRKRKSSPSSPSSAAQAPALDRAVCLLGYQRPNLEKTVLQVGIAENVMRVED